jgi:phenylalanyl-tRNA synthetase beta chain
MYGYDNIKELPLTTYTVGGALPIVGFVDVVREIIIGLGFLEVFSHVLANPQNMFKQMNIDDFGSVAIENFSSATFSSVRSWLLPVLLETLSKNRHVDYPQRLFEQGLVTVRKGNKIIDYERVALVTAHKDANYTEVKQIVDVVMRMVGVEFETVATEHDSFIPGRVSRVIVQGKKVGYVGEIHPKVLTNWELIVPVAGFEINLTELFEVIS